MKLTDEAALRRLLHEEIDLAEAGPAPVDAVFQRSRAVRTRRLAAMVGGAVVLAVAAGVLVARAPGGHFGRPGFSATAPGAARGGVFASGTVNGRPWRLAAVNLADPGYRCLPGVVIDGQNGDLLQAGFLPGMALGNVAFLAAHPGRPWIGFAFLQLRPGVSQVIASLGDGTRLRLRPVSVAVCRQRFILAGFAYPRQGVRRIAARSARGYPIGYTPLAEYFDPASPFQDGSWINAVTVTGDVASGQIGSGRVGGVLWRIRVTLGPDGECFITQTGPAGPGFGTSLCAPVAAPPKGALLSPVPGAGLVWYLGSVSARTAYLRAQESSGRLISLVPAVVDGRRYVVVPVAAGARLTRVVLYDSRGHVLADLTSFPLPL